MRYRVEYVVKDGVVSHEGMIEIEREGAPASFDQDVQDLVRMDSARFVTSGQAGFAITSITQIPNRRESS